MGHFSRLISEPQGQPLRRWINDIPHKGLIRYLDFFNSERIAVFGSTAVAEVLVHKAYDFVKPPQFAKGFGNVFGIGLLLAEGDEHKVHCLPDHIDKTFDCWHTEAAQKSSAGIFISPR